jgi:DNA-binding protein HU-beta
MPDDINPSRAFLVDLFCSWAKVLDQEKGAYTKISQKGARGMNKGDLVNEVAKVLNTKKDAQAAVDCVFSAITKALGKGEAVSVPGFGTFKVAARGARKGRNPQTGEEISIKATKVPRFVAGKGLKDVVK